jgi:hypothetical protein
MTESKRSASAPKGAGGSAKRAKKAFRFQFEELEQGHTGQGVLPTPNEALATWLFACVHYCTSSAGSDLNFLVRYWRHRSFAGTLHAAGLVSPRISEPTNSITSVRAVGFAPN